MIGYWIQRHDYSSDEVSVSSLVDTVEVFNCFDWESELDNFQENVEGKDCPPGIGINNGKSLDAEGSFLLHICPIDKKKVFFNFHYQKPFSIFWINLGVSSGVHHVAEYPRSKISKLIEQVYAKKHEELLEIR